MHPEALIELPEILVRNNIRKFILVGHSDGASIADRKSVVWERV